MKTIIKNKDGTFWVRHFGIYVGTFSTYKDAKNFNNYKPQDNE